jgi:mycothione reductase
MPHHDLVIIGTGSGNVIADERFAHLDIAIVEEGTFGGTCLNVGCIPTKMFVHTADLASATDGSTRFGIDASVDDVRWPDIRDRIFGRIDPIADAGQRFRETSDNITVYAEHARFSGPKQLGLVSGTKVTADRIVIAAGSRAVIPDVPGLADVPLHTSDTIMRIDAVPTSLAILGGGVIAAEMAHVFSALGSKVTVIARSDVLLRSEDRDVARRFTEVVSSRWDLRLARTVAKAETSPDGVRLHLCDQLGQPDPRPVDAQLLLVATGRTPNSDTLAVAETGVVTHADGRVVVDEFQATTVDGIFALGDVSSRYQLKHVANHEARVVQHNLLHPDDPTRADHRFVPYAIFSNPQVAAVGKTEQQLQASNTPYVASCASYADIAYGWAMEDTTGFAKLLADPRTGRLLGGHIIGPQASTVVQPIVQAMSFGLSAREMARGQYWIHPAMPEVVENALLNLPLSTDL